jgi:cellulose synthase/poly-beta-1,6-N-acetylglucosamine synthase-like glycosyltransferase
MDLPFVTIAMPCLNEEAYIEACIRSVQAQDYPKDRMEILVADGGSIDATREILIRLAAEDPRIRTIPNPDRIQAAGLNEIIRRSKGDVIIRMDVHAEYASDFIKKCVQVLEKTGADNVGGAARPKAKTWFQSAVAAALDSPLAVGGSKYRDAENEGYVETVFPGAFRRSVFEKVGLFDPRAVTNEDAEINQRINANGGRVYLSRDIVVYYYPRDSFPALAKQYFRYGQGRARTLLKHGRFLSVRPAIPFLMIAGEALVLATSPWHRLARYTLGAYAVLTGLEALRVGRKAGLPAIPVVWAVFPVLHLAHGIGFAAGLVKYKLEPDWTTAETLAARETNGAATTDQASHA